MLKVTVGQVEFFVNAHDAGAIAIHDKDSIPNRKVRYWLGRALEKCISENKGNNGIVAHRRSMLKEFAEFDEKGNPVTVDREVNGNKIKVFKFFNDKAEADWNKAVEEHRSQVIELAMDPIEHTEDDLDMPMSNLQIIFPFLKEINPSESPKIIPKPE